MLYEKGVVPPHTFACFDAKGENYIVEVLKQRTRKGYMEGEFSYWLKPYRIRILEKEE